MTTRSEWSWSRYTRGCPERIGDRTSAGAPARTSPKSPSRGSWGPRAHRPVSSGRWRVRLWCSRIGSAAPTACRSKRASGSGPSASSGSRRVASPVSSAARQVPTTSRCPVSRSIRSPVQRRTPARWPPPSTALAATSLPVVLGRAASAVDAYAAADVVVFPSTWEGFGNPVIESVIARRPLATHHYPVLDEIVAAGLRVFGVERPGEVAAFLDAPDRTLFETNRELARRDYSLTDLPGRIHAAFVGHGWRSW